MFTRWTWVGAWVVACLGLMACSTAPRSNAKLDSLGQMSQDTLTRFQQTDPSLKPLLDQAVAWAIFPTVGEGAAGVGGSYGRGSVYERGTLIGYCDVWAGTVGLQLGGEQYMELILFQNEPALRRFQSNQWALAADAAAVAAKEGAADRASYADGVVVFTRPISGLIAAAAIGGQKFTYESKEAAQEKARANEMR